MLKRDLRGKKFALLLLVVLLPALLAGIALAQETGKDRAVNRGAATPAARSHVSAAGKGMYESWQALRDGTPARRLDAASPVRLPATVTPFIKYSVTGATACANLIANSQLDILEFGDGTGTAEPWVFLEPIVYYINGNDPNDIFKDWAFDGYSLWLEDGDSGDPSPFIDMFGQGFLMPENLTDVTIDYWRFTDSSNEDDIVWGELWLLDDQGFLHWDQPDQYFIGYWELSESEGEWKMEKVTVPQELVAELEGRWAAVILYNDTDGSLPSAPLAEREVMILDNISLTACYKPDSPAAKRVYMPTVQRPGEVVPVCAPPTESPRDEYSANRGFTQTGANCNSTLSNVDTADYYTYKPTQDGSHTLHLQKLPKGTEWSAMIFTDTDSPQYAKGETSGQCRIDQPGSGDKKVKCDLDKNKDYFIKVSAGSTPLAGGYTMKVVKP